MSHLLKNPILRFAKHNIFGFVLVMLAVLVPPLERAEQKRYQASYYFEQDRPSSIRDIVKLRPTEWHASSKRIWIDSDASTKSSWTKIHIGSTKSEGDQDLVAININPTHRNLKFYLVQDGAIIKSWEKASKDELSISARHGVFRFNAMTEKESDLYIHSENLNKKTPTLRILSYQEYKIEKKNLDVFYGFLIGASIAILLANLITILLLKQHSQSVVAIFFSAILLLSLLMSGTAESLYPALYSDMNLFTLIICWSGVIALSSALAVLDLADDHKAKIARQSETSVKNYLIGAAGSMVALIPIEPFTRPIIMIAVTIVLLAHHELYRAPRQKTDVHQFTAYGYRAGFAPLFLSFLAWYEIIPASTVRIMLFHIGFLVGTFFFSSLMTLKRDLLSSNDRKNIEDIANYSTTGMATAATMDERQTFLHEDHQIVTMFVDIAAFSQLSAPLPSDAVFDQLSARLKSIAEIVREFGGSIDRSLGDGLLCFFGYRSEHSPAFNTQRAFLAARKIQESTISNDVAKQNDGTPHLIMPVRIGIHSSKMIMGNLGGATRIDFTMIGEGVNFASRLETACTPFKVMFSEECYRHLQELGYQDGDFSAISIHMKHKANLVTAYEFDPFRQRRQELLQAEQRYLSQIGIRLADQRLTVQDFGSLVLRSGGQEFLVRDFSIFGFRGVASKQFGRHSRLVVELEIENIQLKEQFIHQFVDKLTIEVRWSQRSISDPTKYEHGFKIIGSSAEQRQFLFEKLSEYYAVKNNVDSDATVHEVA